VDKEELKGHKDQQEIEVIQVLAQIKEIEVPKVLKKD